MSYQQLHAMETDAGSRCWPADLQGSTETTQLLHTATGYRKRALQRDQVPNGMERASGRSVAQEKAAKVKSPNILYKVRRGNLERKAIFCSRCNEEGGQRPRTMLVYSTNLRPIVAKVRPGLCGRVRGARATILPGCHK